MSNWWYEQAEKIIKGLSSGKYLVESVELSGSDIIVSGLKITPDEWNNFVNSDLKKIRERHYHIELRNPLDSEEQNPNYRPFGDNKQILGIYRTAGSTICEIFRLYNDGSFVCNGRLMILRKKYRDMAENIISNFCGKRKTTK